MAKHFTLYYICVECTFRRTIRNRCEIKDFSFSSCKSCNISQTFCVFWMTEWIMLRGEFPETVVVPVDSLPNITSEKALTFSGGSWRQSPCRTDDSILSNILDVLFSNVTKTLFLAFWMLITTKEIRRMDLRTDNWDIRDQNRKRYFEFCNPIFMITLSFDNLRSLCLLHWLFQ